MVRFAFLHNVQPGSETHASRQSKSVGLGVIGGNFVSVSYTARTWLRHLHYGPKSVLASTSFPPRKPYAVLPPKIVTNYTLEVLIGFWGQGD